MTMRFCAKLPGAMPERSRFRRANGTQRRRRGCRMLRCACPTSRCSTWKWRRGDGYQACTNIRSLPGGADLPIVMVTGCGRHAVYRSRLRSRCHRFRGQADQLDAAGISHSLRDCAARGPSKRCDSASKKNAALLKAIPDGIFLVDSAGVVGHCFSPIAGARSNGA